jgi:hypothetical protein
MTVEDRASEVLTLVDRLLRADLEPALDGVVRLLDGLVTFLAQHEHGQKLRKDEYRTHRQQAEATRAELMETFARIRLRRQALFGGTE